MTDSEKIEALERRVRDLEMLVAIEFFAGRGCIGPATECAMEAYGAAGERLVKRANESTRVEAYKLELAILQKKRNDFDGRIAGQRVALDMQIETMLSRINELERKD